MNTFKAYVRTDNGIEIEEIPIKESFTKYRVPIVIHGSAGRWYASEHKSGLSITGFHSSPTRESAKKKVAKILRTQSRSRSYREMLELINNNKKLNEVQ